MSDNTINTPSTAWFLGRRIGSGSYSEVCQVFDINNNQYAAKLALINRQDHLEYLHKEYLLYRHLECEYRDVAGLPRIYKYAKVATIFDGVKDSNMLVMTRLGKSLLDIVVQTEERKLPVGLVMKLAIQAISILEYIHSKGVIHNDIKPGNILCAPHDLNCIHLVDFGFSEFFINRNTGLHVPFSNGHSFRGTLSYASIEHCRGNKRSRKDDLEALGYTLIKLANGNMPWTKDRKLLTKQEMLQMKESTTIVVLCGGLSETFQQYMRYVLALEFDQTPDYAKIRRMFQEGIELILANGTDPGQVRIGSEGALVRYDIERTENGPMIPMMQSDINITPEEACSPWQGGRSESGEGMLNGVNKNVSTSDDTAESENSPSNLVVQLLPAYLMDHTSDSSFRRLNERIGGKRKIMRY